MTFLSTLSSFFHLFLIIIMTSMGFSWVLTTAKSSSYRSSVVTTTTTRQRPHSHDTQCSPGRRLLSFVNADLDGCRERVSHPQRLNLSRHKKLYATSSSPSSSSTSSTASIPQTGADLLDQAKVVQDMLYRIRQVNYMPDDIRQSLLPFVVDGVTVGKVRRESNPILYFYEI